MLKESASGRTTDRLKGLIIRFLRGSCRQTLLGIYRGDDQDQYGRRLESFILCSPAHKGEGTGKVRERPENWKNSENGKVNPGINITNKEYPKDGGLSGEVPIVYDRVRFTLPGGSD